ncbi:hypothetical protein [Dokdonia sp. PRO95]|uniref:hypothetical protein n=1 Tax=Dokdonia sp. PRO95 TaxID=1239415 RepID=UPI00055577DF|nr:hypothetical protein [Dokdonia sp. PRO95]
MSKTTFTCIASLLWLSISFSQIGINTTTPDPSAALDIVSKDKGVLLPSLTTQQRDAIPSPIAGLFIYNSDDNCFQYYKGTAWSTCLAERGENNLDCTSIIVSGNYITGIALNTNNTITIDVLVKVITPYTISTNTTNGYSFSASGIFPHLGVNSITLSATGIPKANQTDTFTITLAGNPNTCNATVVVN